MALIHHSLFLCVFVTFRLWSGASFANCAETDLENERNLIANLSNCYKTSITHNESGYERWLEQVNVNVSLHLIKAELFVRPDDSSVLSASTSLVYSWRDEFLSYCYKRHQHDFVGSNMTLEMTLSLFSLIWLPRFHFLSFNETAEYKDIVVVDVSVENGPFHTISMNENTITLGFAVTKKYPCKSDLDKFPYDEHLCELIVDSNADLNWQNLTLDEGLVENRFYKLFSIGGNGSDISSWAVPMVDQKLITLVSRFVVRLVLRRQSQLRLWLQFFPVGFFACSWLLLLLASKDERSRDAISLVGLFLAFAIYCAALCSSMPLAAYSAVVLRLYTGCAVFLFAHVVILMSAEALRSRFDGRAVYSRIEPRFSFVATPDGGEVYGKTAMPMPMPRNVTLNFFGRNFLNNCLALSAIAFVIFYIVHVSII